MSPQLDEFDEAWIGVSVLNNERHSDVGHEVNSGQHCDIAFFRCVVLGKMLECMRGYFQMMS